MEVIMKIIFMGTPDFAVPSLKAIYDEGYEIPLVITQPDRKKGRQKKISPPPVKVAAVELGLQILQPYSIKENFVIERIKKILPDVIVVVAYGQLIPDAVLQIPRYGCLNVHASLLPKYRGAAPIHWAIINGEKQTGISIMQMDKGLDTGDILAQKILDISIKDNLGSVHDKLSVLGANLLVQTIKLLPSGVNKIPQDENKATYAPKIDRTIEKINWNESAYNIHNLIRGLNPYPGAYTYLNDQLLKIWDSEIESQEIIKGKPGEIIEVNNSEGIFVQTAKGIIKLKELQLAGKKRLPFSEFLKGKSLLKGDIFI
jgi:methionyl-tRNA formyltransferase